MLFEKRGLRCELDFYRDTSYYQILFYFAATITAATVSAEIIGISINPVEVVIGTISICSPNEFNNSDPITGTTWSQRKQFPCGMWTPWQTLSTSREQELRGEYPITYEMKLDTTYGSVPGLPIPHPPTTHYLSRTVFAANGVRDDEGFNVDTPFGQSRTIKSSSLKNPRLEFALQIFQTPQSLFDLQVKVEGVISSQNAGQQCSTASVPNPSASKKAEKQPIATVCAG